LHACDDCIHERISKLTIDQMGAWENANHRVHPCQYCMRAMGNYQDRFERKKTSIDDRAKHDVILNMALKKGESIGLSRMETLENLILSLLDIKDEIYKTKLDTIMSAITPKGYENKECSNERGCEGKINLGTNYKAQADRLARKNNKQFAVYNCPHCKGTHLTTNIVDQDKYPTVLYITGIIQRKHLMKDEEEVIALITDENEGDVIDIGVIISLIVSLLSLIVSIVVLCQTNAILVNLQTMR